MESQKTFLIIPCYNEENRLPVARYKNWIENQDPKDPIHFLFVDDGSKDYTAALIKQELVSLNSGFVSLEVLPKNMGKGEAVRLGMFEAIERGATQVGFADADLATPLTELKRLRGLLNGGKYKVILGSRIKVLGNTIDRNIFRHYFGRIFATLASMTLKLPIYDTQCGAKFFEATPSLQDALREPFISRWAFDIELIGRLIVGSHDAPPYSLSEFSEAPLLMWRDMKGSKISIFAMIWTTIELFLIHLDLKKRASRVE